MKWLFDLIRILMRIFGKNMEVLNTEKTPPWFEIAKNEIGIKEESGTLNNPRILEYHQTTSLMATSDAVPWCSAFVSWCFHQCGIKGTNSALARSWLNWGQEVTVPYKGCVVVLTRGLLWQGHVGFFVHEQNGMIGVLSGNQNDSVCIEYFSVNRVLGYREPKKE